MYKTMFAIFLELLTKGKVSRQHLANKLYCSERSISRYIDRLIDEGVPIKILKGRSGGYELNGEFVASLKRF